MLFDTSTGETRPMRSKEFSHDYRYFPDPDLLPVNLTDEQINQIKPSMEELPHEKMTRYTNEYKIDKDISKIIIAEKENTVLFERMVNESEVTPKNIASWLVGDIFAFIKDKNADALSLLEFTKDITDLLKLISDDVISNKVGKEILPQVLEGKGKAK